MLENCNEWMQQKKYKMFQTQANTTKKFTAKHTKQEKQHDPHKANSKLQ